jgi:hypothetical protein
MGPRRYRGREDERNAAVARRDGDDLRSSSPDISIASESLPTSISPWLKLSVLGALALAGCRDLAGGNQIDALQKSKTVAANISTQNQQRFRDGLKAGSSDADIEAATGEPAP